MGRGRKGITSTSMKKPPRNLNLSEEFLILKNVGEVTPAMVDMAFALPPDILVHIFCPKD